MPWPSAAQTPQPRPVTPVPGGESVRLAALQATWKRDRQVARRRLWWRWAVWGVQRYALPTTAGLSVIAGLWFAARAIMGWPDAAPLPFDQQVASVPAEPPPRQAAPVPSPSTPENPPIPREPSPPKTVTTPSGMVLMFEIGLTESSTRTHRSTQSPVSSAALSDAATIPNPQLISENWLHSKEP
jgi:hypothetical protein